MIDRIPPSLITRGLEQIKVVSYKVVDPTIVAHVEGDTIYLSDKTFDPEMTYLDLVNVMIHEMVHIVQLNTVESDTIKNLIKKNKEIDMNKDIQLVQDYIKVTGWTLTDDGEEYVIDTKLGSHMTTDYGKFGGPSEDMADSISYYYTGRKSYLSKERITWIEKFMEADKDWKNYMFEFPEKYEVTSTIPDVYVNSLSGK